MPRNTEQRTQVIKLIQEYSSTRNAEIVARLVALLPDTDIENLLHSDLDAETIADICMGTSTEPSGTLRDKMVSIVTQFLKIEFPTEAESIAAAIWFKENCRHEAGTDLIFYPEEVFDGNPNPSIEEIVQKALGEQG